MYIDVCLHEGSTEGDQGYVWKWILDCSLMNWIFLVAVCEMIPVSGIDKGDSILLLGSYWPRNQWNEITKTVFWFEGGFPKAACWGLWAIL
jgi:hypothetical protein